MPVKSVEKRPSYLEQASSVNLPTNLQQKKIFAVISRLISNRVLTVDLTIWPGKRGVCLTMSFQFFTLNFPNKNFEIQLLKPLPIPDFDRR